MLSNFLLFGLIISLVWLLIITIFFWKIKQHYNNLLKGTTGTNLTSVLENILKDLASSKKDLSFLKSYVDKIHKDGLFHIQKVGLVRFNPFKDTGGDQSFILSLIDGKDTGVVISGLYSRSGTRWYAKKIVGGKGVDHELSEEEKKAILEAKGTGTNQN